MTSIGKGAFSKCTRLTDITIPDSVTSIGDQAFSYCSSLTSVVMPDSVTSIGDEVFEGCSEYLTITGYESAEGTEDGERYSPDDFVDENAYREYLDFGDTSGLK